MTKFEIKKSLEKMAQNDSNWLKLEKSNRDKILEELSEMGYQIFEETKKSVEETLDIVRQREENFMFLFLGSILGITGGLVATIINNVLLKVELPYYLNYFIPILIFLFVVIFSFFYVGNKNNSTIRNNKILQELLLSIRNRK